MASIEMNLPFKFVVEDAEMEICLKIVEIWLNKHPDKRIVTEQQLDGNIKVKIEDRMKYRGE